MKIVQIALIGLVSGIKINMLGDPEDNVPQSLNRTVVIQPAAWPKVPEPSRTPEEREQAEKDAWAAYNQTVQKDKKLKEAHEEKFGYPKKSHAQNDTEDLTFEEREKAAWDKFNQTVQRNKEIVEAHEQKFGYPKKSHAQNDTETFPTQEMKEKEAWAKFNETVVRHKAIVDAHEQKFGYPKRAQISNGHKPDLNATAIDGDEHDDGLTDYQRKEKEAWAANNVTVTKIKKIQEAHEDKFGYPKKSLSQVSKKDDEGIEALDKKECEYKANDDKTACVLKANMDGCKAPAVVPSKLPECDDQ